MKCSNQNQYHVCQSIPGNSRCSTILSLNPIKLCTTLCVVIFCSLKSYMSWWTLLASLTRFLNLLFSSSSKFCDRWKIWTVWCSIVYWDVVSLVEVTSYHSNVRSRISLLLRKVAVLISYGYVWVACLYFDTTLHTHVHLWYGQINFLMTRLLINELLVTNWPWYIVGIRTCLV